MLKDISNLGSVLNKVEQKTINGGIHICASDGCPDGLTCFKWGCRNLIDFL